MIDYRLIFVSMTNILLLSSLISLMSMSLEGVGCYIERKKKYSVANKFLQTKVMRHAREEYLFQSVFFSLSA